MSDGTTAKGGERDNITETVLSPEQHARAMASLQADDDFERRCCLGGSDMDAFRAIVVETMTRHALADIIGEGAAALMVEWLKRYGDVHECDGCALLTETVYPIADGLGCEECEEEDEE